ncbi:MAG: urate hydroxylase PuuD [Proteobacteria bacterium]|nr:urate hydroxylase PuuD [Pseudomonadota bacterium]
MELGADFWSFIFRWIHVLSGIMWVGLLYYFNFVQVPSMPKIPDEQKPAISKVIAPRALFWFRWAALSTVAFGLLVAWMEGYLGSALALGMTESAMSAPAGVAGAATIGFGMWFGIIMAFNVWVIIWPNQQKVLGMKQAGDDEKKRAARMAFLASRTNVVLSLPMLFAMLGLRHFANLIG